jgi:hypothetical protein
MASSQFSKTYHSFSGVDIKGVFGTTVIAELQAVSYSITREKAPLYTMGSADPRSFSRGKRGIAGTLIFIMFDRHALLSTFGLGSATPSYFVANVDDFKPNTAANPGDMNQSMPITTLATPAGSPIGWSTANQPGPLNVGIADDSEIAAPWFADQIPPFDVTLAAVNEYGAMAVMRIFGVEILNEGYGVSIDDIVSEMQNTYIARTLTAWTPVPLPANMASQIPGANL